MKRMESKKLSKVVSTKLTSEDYDLCRKIAREYYINEKIKSPSVSELTRLVLYRVLDTYRHRKNIPSDAQPPRSSFRFPKVGR
ncbi:MAG: hypothetical protein GEU26_02175 [Nitrososphaeraceae archaeon]|nr:hypothetical protein [Nitrososphaeraceae archaeon]